MKRPMVIEIWVAPDEKGLIMRAAHHKGLSMASFVRGTAVDKAREVLGRTAEQREGESER